MAEPNLGIFYKNFQAFRGISHIGLGVSGMLTAKYLMNQGIRARAIAIASSADVRTAIAQAADTGYPLTHVVVSAPWLPTADLAALCRDFPFMNFAMNCHSNVGFLQADASGARLFREDLELELGTSNFNVGANSATFVNWVEQAYRRPCLYLPNLYFIDPTTNPNRPGWPQTGGVLRIGIFGALRAQKNVMTAVAAAIEISSILKAQTEIWISSNREDDQAARMIMNAVRALTANLPNVSLVPNPWSGWAQFRQVVANTHLLEQVSYTESFNLVTADGCAEGVPSVVSSAIDWAPPQWFADVDDAQDVASTGISLIMNPNSARQGLRALQTHNTSGFLAWQRFLSNSLF